MLLIVAGAELHEENHPYSEKEHSKDPDYVVDHVRGSIVEFHLIPPRQAPEAQGHLGY